MESREGEMDAPEYGDKGRGKQSDETIATAVDECIALFGTKPNKFKAVCTVCFT
jgi:hypothetical protein